jgi:transcription initiation factor IIE alpha subunit
MNQFLKLLWRPICKTNKDGETVLIAIEGTEKNNIAQAIQVHLECLDLQWNKQYNIIYQKCDSNSTNSDPDTFICKKCKVKAKYAYGIGEYCPKCGNDYGLVKEKKQ